MDSREMEERLARHSVEPEDDTPVEPAEDAAEAADDKPPEALVKTVGDVIRLAGGHDSRVVVALLKTVGALEERDGELVYSLSGKLGPALGIDQHKGVTKITFATALTGYHKRRMVRLSEGHENAVLLTWVEALTGMARDFVDRLCWNDAEACIAIAHYIEGQAGNA